VPLTLHHVAIQCRDLAVCERFYREVLGLPVARRWPGEGGGDRSVWLSTGPEGFLALERADGPDQPAAQVAPRPFRDHQPGLHLLALRIAPAERAGWEARLSAAGVEVVHRTRWTLYVRDPEGNRIGLSHHPEDPP
jgi:glyoxylase I family protein